MHWADTAILLSIRKHGENSAVIHAFTEQHGVHAGVVKGIHSKTMRGCAQPGNVVEAQWNARLPEQLGLYKLELKHATAALAMQDAQALMLLSSACSLLDMALPERHPYPKLYQQFHGFVLQLVEGAPLAEYVRLELALLAETGFGLDLSRCAGTGTTEDLIYVSPKTGRAVCREAGEPYKDKLFRLPEFLLHPNTPPQGGREILDGLAITGYFLEHWLLAATGRKMPASRNRLRAGLYKPAETL